MAISLTEQLECVRREITFRKRVYKRRIEHGQMSQAKADEEIARMEAVLATLLGVEKGELLI